MSQENVEAIRLAVEETNEGEFGGRFNAILAPHLHFRDELGTLDSRDDLHAYIESYRESFGGFHVEIEEVRDLGDTIVLVIESKWPRDWQRCRGRAALHLGYDLRPERMRPLAHLRGSRTGPRSRRDRG